MRLRDFVIEKMDELKLNRADFGTKCGVSYGTITNIVEGRKVGLGMIAKIARAFGRHPGSFIEWEGPDVPTDDLTPVPASYRTIPVISYAQGGDNKYWEEGGYPVGNGFEKISCPPQISDPHAFAFRVQGNSMAPRYYEGETVVVDTTKQVCNGDDVVVRLRDGRVMVKRYRKTNGTVLLESYSAVDEVIVVSESEISRCFKVVCRL